jgi:hypothetical protein
MAMLPNPLPRLADDPTGATLGLRLPPGTLVDATDDEPGQDPLLWYADGTAAPDTWSELLAVRSVGLLPVLIENDKAPGRKFADWYLDPDQMSYPGDHDAEEFLAECWSAYTADFAPEDTGDAAGPAGAADAADTAEASGAAGASHQGGDEDDLRELLAPYGFDWPGLAAAPSFDADPDAVAAEITAELVGTGWLDAPRAALVHARRSADIPAAMGWTGPVNHENDIAVLSAVLRSWEDRFGLRVVALGFDSLTASIAAPPQSQEEAEAVAAEHFAFCPDNITQGNHESLREYARKAVLGKPTWHFWWD